MCVFLFFVYRSVGVCEFIFEDDFKLFYRVDADDDAADSVFKRFENFTTFFQRNLCRVANMMHLTHLIINDCLLLNCTRTKFN